MVLLKQNQVEFQAMPKREIAIPGYVEFWNRQKKIMRIRYLVDSASNKCFHATYNLREHKKYLPSL
jgi:hypothetical protein